MRKVIFVDFNKRRVMGHDDALQQDPRALEAMADHWLGEDSDEGLDALDGDLTPYDEDVSEQHQGRDPWFKFFLLDGGRL